MPLIDKNSLKSFFPNGSFIFKDPTPEGHDEAVKQATDMVFQNTLIPTPDSIENAIPTLQFYAHCIYAYIIANKQDNLDEKELDKYRKMYMDAKEELEQIRTGNKDIYDNNGNIVETGFSATETYYVNTDRQERI